MREISYLIPVDSYSKWPEFIPMNFTTTGKVVNSLTIAYQKLLCPEMLGRFRGVSRWVFYSPPKWSEEKRDSDFNSDKSVEPSDKEIGIGNKARKNGGFWCGIFLLLLQQGFLMSRNCVRNSEAYQLYPRYIELIGDSLDDLENI